MPTPALRKEVISIYKELLNLGREYPLGYTYFRTRLHKAFMANASMENESDIRKGIERAEFVRKGTILKGIERCDKDTKKDEE
ncbi:predicted protein [Sclerotinia sclerotiorum 1980 UF-70]|uniref:LYR family protein n=1 Tax=Sclerotinia sclerotiorum (strain ATCC 18683 / 1980 / Ss-1) TaxID=665079 RepID=A7F4S5_SCLS1|nr:predicted protein [Sclerotinia sclerotiorum 1980 UF-70]EDN97746.1 predicted protein [Sclerotinia sclerotiorum 1980 UF-70]